MKLPLPLPPSLCSGCGGLEEAKQHTELHGGGEAQSPEGGGSLSLTSALLPVSPPPPSLYIIMYTACPA